MPSRRTRRRCRFFILAAALFIPLASFHASAAPVDLTLVLAVDVSDSIDATESRLQREGYINAFQRPEILQAVKSGQYGRIAVAYFEWADVAEQALIVDWMIIEDQASARSFGQRLGAATLNGGHFTSISAAITYGITLLRNAPHESDRKVIDISGDGRSNDGPPLEIARAAAKTWNVTINGLPIDNERSQAAGNMVPGEIAQYYREKVITGPNAFVVVAKDFIDFEHAISRKLLREIADTRPDDTKENTKDNTAPKRKTAAR